MTKTTVSGVEIETLKGDITDSAADVIVNSANSELWMGSGVAGAIRRKGGTSIELEAVAKGPIQIGQAVATSAGSLKAKWVVHAAAMGPDLKTDAEKIRSATRSALRISSELRAESIALPSLGTGVGGFPISQAAEIMVRESVVHASQNRLPRRIIFVLFSEDAKKAFDESLCAVTE